MCNNWNFKINFDSRKPKRNSTPTSARNLEIVFMDAHIKNVCKAMYFQIQNINELGMCLMMTLLQNLFML